jgi:hypothetical protein
MGSGIFGSGVDDWTLCPCVVELYIMDLFEQGIFSINIEMNLLVF